MADAQNESTQNNEQVLQNGDATGQESDTDGLIRTYKQKIDVMEKEIQGKDKELANYKSKVTQMEEEVQQAQKIKAQHLKEAQEVDELKTKSEDTLTKAKGLIFERTKVIKNQELQIEALNQQVESLKDVVTITKDLLEIRNMEVVQLEIKMKCMEDKISAEKERQDLMHKKLETMIRHNGELKREYETQLCLFNALRERYQERELAKGVVDQLRNDSTPGENHSASTSAADSEAKPQDESTTSQQPEEPPK